VNTSQAENSSKPMSGLQRPRIIAEIGVNHEGSLDRAKKLIDLAASAGADVCKFQTYSASRLAAKHASPAYWDTSKETTGSQYDLFSKLGTFKDADYEAIARHCESAGVQFMSTPFDLEAADFLNSYMNEFKIASADLTNIPLIEAVLGFDKPVIFSTGAASLVEIDKLAESLTSHRKSVTFMHCVLNYPTKLADANLACITTLKKRLSPRFDIGYSDHVAPDQFGRMQSLETAFFLGATVIEKHFTDDKSAQGNDHYHSMDSDDLKAFLKWIRDASEMLGTGVPNLEIQKAARENARRRIFYKSDLPIGHVLTGDDLIALRANVGIEVSKWKETVGATLTAEVVEGAPALASHLSAK
jgi:sialic acid synthase SpsE